jgi:predicted MFS family arabinose efflux permease
MGLIECLTCLLLSFVIFKEATVVAALLFLMNFSVAVMDVVIDSLMVCQSRLDPDYGAEDLNTLAWTMVGFGGIVGSVAGGLINEHSSPRFCYLFTAGLGFFTMLLAVLMNKQIENADESVI